MAFSGKLLGKCILYFYWILLSLIHSQDGEDWPKNSSLFDHCLWVYIFAEGGEGHGKERASMEADPGVEREVPSASTPAVFCYSEKQGPP